MCVCVSACLLTVAYREEIEKQRAAESYRKLHEAGKTDEARRDLARLAIIRQQREETAKRREADRKGDLSLYSNEHLLPPPLQLKKLQQQRKNELLLCYSCVAIPVKKSIIILLQYFWILNVSQLNAAGKIILVWRLMIWYGSLLAALHQ